MSTANNVELLLITIVLTASFIGITILIVESWLVVRQIKRVVKKAESFINSVESATESLKNMSKAATQRMPIVNFLNSLLNSKEEK